MMLKPISASRQVHKSACHSKWRMRGAVRGAATLTMWLSVRVSDRSYRQLTAAVKPGLLGLHAGELEDRRVLLVRQSHHRQPAHPDQWTFRKPPVRFDLIEPNRSRQSHASAHVNDDRSLVILFRIGVRRSLDRRQTDRLAFITCVVG